jgi:hypothetical protein
MRELDGTGGPFNVGVMSRMLSAIARRSESGALRPTLEQSPELIAVKTRVSQDPGERPALELPVERHLSWVRRPGCRMRT